MIISSTNDQRSADDSCHVCVSVVSLALVRPSLTLLGGFSTVGRPAPSRPLRRANKISYVQVHPTKKVFFGQTRDDIINTT